MPSPTERDATSDSAPPALTIRNLTKAFGLRKVLDAVSFSVRAGDVHGLMGENGSGKSTLIKILSGFHAADDGDVVLGVGTDTEAHHLRTQTIAFVHQDLALIPGATVLENFCIQSFETGPSGRIRWRANRERAEAALARFDLHIPVATPVAELTAAERAFLAIARAVDNLPATGGVLVLDEPTAYLPHDGVERLMTLMRRVAASGVAVLFVSHDVGEVLEVSDRVTVLRDGVAVATLDSASVTEAELIQHIVGRPVESASRRNEAGPPASGRPVLSVHDVRTDSLSVDALEIGRGQVLGLTGLVGSGFEELLYILYGVRPGSSGSVRIEDAAPVDLRRVTAPRMIRAGIGLIPADRHAEGSTPIASATENLSMVHLGRFTRTAGWISTGRERSWSESVMKDFGVRPVLPQQQFGLFSGGNQQKLVMAKWLELSPKVLLVHEPTQGVDVGARQDIYAKIREAAAAGTSFIVATANYDELHEICDRVAVFRKGKVVGLLTGSAIDKHEISRLCYSGGERIAS